MCSDLCLRIITLTAELMSRLTITGRKQLEGRKLLESSSLGKRSSRFELEIYQ